MKLQIVGGGKMGEALLGGVLSSGWATPEEVLVVEPSAERRNELAATHDGVHVVEAVHDGIDAIIAVKPQYVAEVTAALGTALAPRILSVAAGVTIASMEAAAPAARIVRCMPNTPALVGEGASAIAGGTLADDADLAWAESILGAVGLVVRVDEVDIDAVTGLSGSGPAYVFHLAEALIAAGIAQGLTPEVADILARQTLLGASKLLTESGEDPAVLRQNVTSPGGTTAAGLAVFADADFEGIVQRVVDAAVARSIELGQS
ncbi:MAG: pyrroline-5-carboxylate reductase [Acidimicrobiia bacterium]|nr:pyrroline-5-carboxylate reductase [Acidimicrobiia bacterium]